MKKALLKERRFFRWDGEVLGKLPYFLLESRFSLGGAAS